MLFSLLIRPQHRHERNISFPPPPFSCYFQQKWFKEETIWPTAGDHTALGFSTTGQIIYTTPVCSNSVGWGKVWQSYCMHIGIQSRSVTICVGKEEGIQITYHCDGAHRLGLGFPPFRTQWIPSHGNWPKQIKQTILATSEELNGT